MPDKSDDGLKRELTSFQQAMIAIGGIVGVGEDNRSMLVPDGYLASSTRS